jgi:hypothetical protein
MKTRGFAWMRMHGIAKARSVCLLHGLAHSLLWADRLHAVAAAAA